MKLVFTQTQEETKAGSCSVLTIYLIKKDFELDLSFINNELKFNVHLNDSRPDCCHSKKNKQTGFTNN